MCPHSWQSISSSSNPKPLLQLIPSRYMILDINGVRNAIQTGASAKGQRPTQADKEKKDRAVAKTILDKLGMESEKYRLGYTKVRVLLVQMHLSDNIK